MPRGAPKGDNRFKQSQIEKQEKRKKGVEAIIKVLSSSKVSFNSMNHLAEYVAEQFNHLVGQDGYDGKYGFVQISKSTLLRNLKYRQCLVSYLAEGVNTPQKNKNKAEALSSEIENKDQKDRADRLERYLANQGIDPSKLLEKSPSKKAGVDLASIKKLECCYRIIEALINQSDDLFEIRGDSLVDATTATERNIVSPATLRDSSFLDWLSSKECT
ncbi:hypothetical protein [Ferrimonas sediminicola]|nr:hypothetical protein [Ferrimonas sediminicola]